MNRDNQELQILLKNLDSIVGEIKHVLFSTKPVPSNRKGTPFFLSKTDNSDVENQRILTKINLYTKLREETHDSYNSELEVSFLMDIFANAGALIKKISEGRVVSDYTDSGFFNGFSDISHKIEGLIV